MALAGDGHQALSEVEALLRSSYAAREVLLTDSGTSALALALRLAAARDGSGGERSVALPAWGCYDLATAADVAGLPVLLYDLDPATLGPDWASLDRVLEHAPAAVVVVHAFGVPVDLPRVQERLAAAGALMIEDAAQAIGTTLGDSPAGSLGELGILSFGRGKGWTGGGGGALLLNRSAPVNLHRPPVARPRPSRRGTRNLVGLTAQWLLARPSLYALPAAMPFLKLGQTLYRQGVPPEGMLAAVAAVLLGTGPLQKAEADRRRLNAQRLTAALQAALAGEVPAGWKDGEPGWLRLPFLPGPRLAGPAQEGTARRLGITPGYPLPLERLPGFGQRVRNLQVSRPGAVHLAAHLYSLPTHGLLQERDLVRLEQWLARAGRRR